MPDTTETDPPKELEDDILDEDNEDEEDEGDEAEDEEDREAA